MDTVSKEKRAQIMRSVKSSGTTPEKKVTALIQELGYRCLRPIIRIPGNPDIIVPKLKVAIFVNGCFWHRHKSCKEATMPATNIDYWRKKFEKNVVRDKENLYKTRNIGWKTHVVWECETKRPDRLSKKLGRWFKKQSTNIAE